VSEEFKAALAKLPLPVTDYSNGAVCPWCGELHRTITYGGNNCQSCARFFCFGYPDWDAGPGPMSWVPFPWKEFDAVGQKASALADWKPNDVLQAIYFEMAEKRIGKSASDGGPQ
jgi:hypothetical protein